MTALTHELIERIPVKHADMDEWVMDRSGALYTEKVASCTVAVLHNPNTKSSFLGHFCQVAYEEPYMDGHRKLAEMLHALQQTSEDPSEFIAWLGGGNYKYGDDGGDFPDIADDREYLFEEILAAGIPTRSISLTWNDVPYSSCWVSFKIDEAELEVGIVPGPGRKEQGIDVFNFRIAGQNWGEL